MISRPFFRLLIVFLSIVTLAGCTDRGEPLRPLTGATLLFIDIEGDFQGEYVQVWIDQQLVAQESAVTNWTVSLAWSKQISGLPSGSHVLRVRLRDFGVVGTATIDIRDTTTVLVDYNRTTQELSFETFYGLFFRD
jgi:hypothetical protein